MTRINSLRSKMSVCNSGSAPCPRPRRRALSCTIALFPNVGRADAGAAAEQLDLLDQAHTEHVRVRNDLRFQA